MRWVVGLAVVVAVGGCGGPVMRPPDRKALPAVPEESETIPSDVLERSDPTAETEGNEVIERGGCGGLLNPCPDVLRPNGGCFGCPPPTGERGTFPRRGAVPFALALLWLRRRSRPG